jgi:hypothetical protein
MTGLGLYLSSFPEYFYAIRLCRYDIAFPHTSWEKRIKIAEDVKTGFPSSSKESIIANSQIPLVCSSGM